MFVVVCRVCFKGVRQGDFELDRRRSHERGLAMAFYVYQTVGEESGSVRRGCRSRMVE